MGVQTGKRVLELQYPARRDAVYDLRRRFDQFMSGYLGSGGSREEVDGVKVALSEAATNAICYGSPAGEKDRVSIRFELDGTDLIIEITDQGTGFRPSAIQLPEEDEFQPSGRGLWIMEALMDHVEFLPGEGKGTRVRMTKHLPTAATGTRPGTAVSASAARSGSGSESFAPAMAAGSFGD